MAVVGELDVGRRTVRARLADAVPQEGLPSASDWLVERISGARLDRASRAAGEPGPRLGREVRASRCAVGARVHSPHLPAADGG